MSIATAITDLSGRIQAAYDALSAKGAEMPETRDSYHLSATIDSIPAGGGSNGYTLTMIDNNTTISPQGYEEMTSRYLKADGTSGNSNFYRGEPSPKIVDNVVAYGNINIGQLQLVLLTADTTIYVKVPCLLAGTKILLADGTEKNVEDISYDDMLATWDFEQGKLSAAKPIWIKKRGSADYSFTCTFKSGRVLKITGKSDTGWGHRGFNLTRGSFTYFPASVGDTFATIDGADELIGCKKEFEEVDYYNVITVNHFNCFANKILTSCSLNNYRKFNAAEMRFSEAAKVCHDEAEFTGIIPEIYVKGLHLCEQPTEKEKLIAYVDNLLRLKVST